MFPKYVNFRFRMAVTDKCSHYLDRKSITERYRFTHQDKKLGGKLEIT
jgi:hypothetical protein